MVICLILTGFVLKNRISLKQKEEITNDIQKSRLDLKDRIKEEPTMHETEEVEMILKELDSLKVKKKPVEEIKVTGPETIHFNKEEKSNIIRAEIMPPKIEKKKIDESLMHNVQTKKEILENLKDTYSLNQLNEKNKDFPALIEK